MKMHDLFTPESLERAQKRRDAALGPARELFDQYCKDRDDELSASPCLQKWIAALEEGNLDAATDATLWSQLLGKGYIEIPSEASPRGDNAVFRLRIISPKILDGFRSDDLPQSNYSFTTVEICFRAKDVDPAKVELPQDLKNPRLIDTELFEIPDGVSDDNFDDREKIHVVYLAGMREGTFVRKPIYIGVGTGEAYGRGPSKRNTQGRFRFYRYDGKDNSHLEYVQFLESAESRRKNVQALPEIPEITDARATLVLAKSSGDRSFMCLSDPMVAKAHSDWLREYQVNEVVYKDLRLEKKHYDLPVGCPSLAFAPDDVPAVLRYAWQWQRYYYVAWQHPNRLSEIDGILPYYKEFAEFRRHQYETCRFRPEFFGMPGPEGPTIPDVLGSKKLIEQLEKNAPGAKERLLSWLKEKVVGDLYAFGNHPELRLYTAIALWFRLQERGFWDDALEKTYRNRLFELEFSERSFAGG